MLIINPVMLISMPILMPYQEKSVALIRFMNRGQKLNYFDFAQENPVSSKKEFICGKGLHVNVYRPVFSSLCLPEVISHRLSQ